MARRKVILIIGLLISLTISACGGQPAPDVQSIETRTAARIFATQTASVSTQTHMLRPTLPPNLTQSPLPPSDVRSIFAWSAADGSCLAQTMGLYLTNPAQYTAEEFVTAAKKAAIQFPSEWVVFYTLCDAYQGVKRYADALTPCKRTYELRRDDLRSTYALGTAYNLLTRAAWGQSEIEAYSAWLKQNPNASPELVLDPTQEKQLAEKALKQTGLTVQTAASQAIELLERTFVCNPDNESKSIVQQDLDTLYKRFPNARASATPTPSSGTGAGARFNAIVATWAAQRTRMAGAPPVAPTPRSTRPKASATTPVRQADGYLVGNLEWRVEGYILVDDAKKVEVQTVFHTQSSRASIALDFQMVADDQEACSPVMQLAYLHADAVTAYPGRRWQGIETMKPNSYMRATFTCNTPASCMSAGSGVDACMRSKEIRIRWLQYGLEFPVRMFEK